MRASPASTVSRLSALALALAAIGVTSGCSSVNTVIQGKSVDYESAKAGPDLAVPPDLSQFTRDQQYAMPAGTGHQSVSASAYQSAAAKNAEQSASSTVLPQYPGMHIEQAGAQRWLVVDATPDQLWDKVKEFWQQNGLYLSKADPATGEMETDWAENRAKLPQDFIRKYLGKVFDSLYDTGERDRYRTVFERTPDGRGTQIIITHQSMVEVYSNADKTQTTWQPGTPDPSLDALFLRRLMVKLGMKEEQAKVAMEAAAAPAGAIHATLVDGGAALALTDGFAEGWRRVGLAVSTAGFTVTDRNRSAGTYDVRYVDPATALKASQANSGFFGRIFGGDTQIKPEEFRILVKGDDKSTRVSVQPLHPSSDSGKSTQDILKVLLQQLQ